MAKLFNGKRTSQLTVPAAASAAAVSGPCVFYGLIVKTDGTNNVTVNVYDNTAASGTKLLPTSTVIPGTSRLFAVDFSDAPILCDNGVYVDISVAGGGSFSYQVQYDS